MTEASGGSGGSGGLTGEKVSTGKCFYGSRSGGDLGCEGGGRAVTIIFKEEEQGCIKQRNVGGGSGGGRTRRRSSHHHGYGEKQSCFRERREERRGSSWGEPSEQPWDAGLREFTLLFLYILQDSHLKYHLSFLMIQSLVLREKWEIKSTVNAIPHDHIIMEETSSSSSFGLLCNFRKDHLDPCKMLAR
ncbi:hypothetical protein Bca4012_062521 [Brassica carinata]